VYSKSESNDDNGCGKNGTAYPFISFQEKTTVYFSYLMIFL